MILPLFAVVAGAGPLRDLEVESAAVEARYARLADRLATQGGMASENRGSALFEEALLAFMLEDYDRAAMGFFVLVNRGTTEGALLDDGLWYLARSTEELGFTRFAIDIFVEVASDPTHALRDDALERLLLLYAEHGPPQAYENTLKRALAEQRLEFTPRRTYFLGKARALLGESAEAIATFERIPPDSSWYARGRYFSGVVRLRDGDVDGASATFQALRGHVPVGPEEEEVRDLAILASARIALHQERPAEAAEIYLSLPIDSPAVAEAQVEIGWAWLEADEPLAALDAFERLRREQPDRAESSRVPLLVGHVLFREGAMTQADTSYRDAAEGFRGVRETVESLDMHDPAQKEALTQLEVWTDTPGGPPRWALERLSESSHVREVLEVDRELARQSDELQQCSHMVMELTHVLGSSPVLGRFQSYRDESDSVVDQAVGLHLRALEWELDHLTRAAPEIELMVRHEALVDGTRAVAGERSALAGRIGRLRASRSAAQATLEDAGPWGERGDAEAVVASVNAELTALLAERRAASWSTELLDALRALRADLRSHRGEADFSRVDALYARWDALIEDAVELRAGTLADEDAARGPIEQVLQTEVGRLSRLRGEHAEVSQRGQALWNRASVEGLREVVAWLTAAEEEAEAGEVDVAWNALMDTTDRAEIDREARTDRAREIELRFDYLRQGL